MLSQMTTRAFWRGLYVKISDDNVFNGAAALGFYLTLAIFPAFIVMMTVIPYLPIEDVDEAIMDLVAQAMPQDSAALVEDIVLEVTQQQRGGLLSFGLLATVWAASTGMYAIMQQLNITYDVKESRNYFYARVTALVLSVAFGILVIGAFSLVVLGGVLESWIAGTIGDSQALVIAFRAFRWIVIFVALLLFFALLYRYAPNVDERFAFITPGSVVGVLLLVLASTGFSVYIANFGDYDATYGSIGAVIILMLWLYIFGLVVLVGSEINVLLKRNQGDGAGDTSTRTGQHRSEEEAAASSGRVRPRIMTITLTAVFHFAADWIRQRGKDEDAGFDGNVKEPASRKKLK